MLKITVYDKEFDTSIHDFEASNIDDGLLVMEKLFGEDHAKKYEIEIEDLESPQPNNENQKEVYKRIVEMKMNKFKNLPFEEKLVRLNEKLKKHNEFLENIKGSGRTYSGDVVLDNDEFQWIMSKLNELNTQ